MIWCRWAGRPEDERPGTLQMFTAQQTVTSCLSAGEHDQPGGDGHPGWEGRQAGVHRPVEEDADAGRRQADHAHEDSEPPLCHHDAPAALPPQLTVSQHGQDWLGVSQVDLDAVVFCRFAFWPLLNLFCSVKSCFQNMDICKRRCSAFENGKNLFASTNTPSAATNLTVTFSSQLNQHNQVGLLSPAGYRISFFSEEMCCWSSCHSFQFLCEVMALRPRLLTSCSHCVTIDVFAHLYVNDLF